MGEKKEIHSQEPASSGGAKGPSPHCAGNRRSPIIALGNTKSPAMSYKRVRAEYSKTCVRVMIFRMKTSLPASPYNADSFEGDASDAR